METQSVVSDVKLQKKQTCNRLVNVVQPIFSVFVKFQTLADETSLRQTCKASHNILYFSARQNRLQELKINYYD